MKGTIPPSKPQSVLRIVHVHSQESVVSKAHLINTTIHRNLLNHQDAYSCSHCTFTLLSLRLRFDGSPLAHTEKATGPEGRQQEAVNGSSCDAAEVQTRTADRHETHHVALS